MNYELYPATIKDKDFIYELKKSCIIAFVEEIWGWDENYQIKDFNENFVLNNFQMVAVNTQQIGFIELNCNNDNINITELHMLPEYRCNGIGTGINQTPRSKLRGMYWHFMSVFVTTTVFQTASLQT